MYDPLHQHYAGHDPLSELSNMLRDGQTFSHSIQYLNYAWKADDVPTLASEPTVIDAL